MRDLQHQPKSAGIFFRGGLRENVPPEEPPGSLCSSSAAADSQGRTGAPGELRRTAAGAAALSLQKLEDIPALADLVILREGL